MIPAASRPLRAREARGGVAKTGPNRSVRGGSVKEGIRRARKRKTRGPRSIAHAFLVGMRFIRGPCKISRLPLSLLRPPRSTVQNACTAPNVQIERSGVKQAEREAKQCSCVPAGGARASFAAASEAFGKQDCAARTTSTTTHRRDPPLTRATLHSAQAASPPDIYSPRPPPPPPPRHHHETTRSRAPWWCRRPPRLALLLRSGSRHAAPRSSQPRRRLRPPPRRR